MSRSSQASKSSQEALDQVMASLATTQEHASLLEKFLWHAPAHSAAPLPVNNSLRKAMTDQTKTGPMADEDSFKDLIAAVSQPRILFPSENSCASVQQCPAFDTWHPLTILNEYNRLNPGQGVSATTSMFLDDVSALPEKDRAAHADRVKYLKQNWKRLESTRRFQPRTMDPTKAPLTEEERMQLRLRHQMMDEVDRLTSMFPEKYTCPRPAPAVDRSASAYKWHEHACSLANQKMDESRKSMENAAKRGKEAKGGATAGAKEQAGEEDWVVVNDMDAVEDPFVIVYDEAKFRRAE